MRDEKSPIADAPENGLTAKEYGRVEDTPEWDPPAYDTIEETPGSSIEDEESDIEDALKQGFLSDKDCHATGTQERHLLANNDPEKTPKWQQSIIKTYSHRNSKRVAIAIASVIIAVLVVTVLLEQSVSSNAHSRPRVRKAIIASQWEQAITSPWIRKLLPDWEMNVYDMSQLTFITNDVAKSNQSSFTSRNGNEVAPYLTYLVDNYEDLPDYMVFYHGPRYQWHNDDPMFDGYATITNLSLDFVDEQGYVSLRCATWPGCDGQPSPVEKVKPDGFFDWQHLKAQIHEEFWPNLSVPDELETYCCAQFAVSRKAVQMNSHDDYKRWREWVSTHNGLGMNVKIGMAMEFQWQIMFGKPASWCPMTPKECYCKKWGLCDLECDEMRCKGQWFQHEQGYKALPATWPDQDVQGTDGWPKEGWWNSLDENWNYSPAQNEGE